MNDTVHCTVYCTVYIAQRIIESDNIFLYSPPVPVGFYYVICTVFTVQSAALWGGSWPRFEPGTGNLQAETLTTRKIYNSSDNDI